MARTPPKSVKIAVWLLVISLVLSMISWFVSIPGMAQSTNMKLFLVALCLAIPSFFFFLYWRLYQGRNWARITILVLTIISIAFAVPGFILMFKRGIQFDLGLGEKVLAFFANAVSVYAIYVFFFTKEREWFKPRQDTE